MTSRQAFGSGRTPVAVIALVLATVLVTTFAPPVTAAESQGAPRRGTRPDRLVIQGPNNFVIAGALRLATEGGLLDDLADEVEYVQWSTPEELRARIINDEAQVSAVPLNVAAQLYNRGVDVRVLGVTAWHLLWLVGPEGTRIDWRDLRGKTVHVPFRNDLPDLVFSSLLAANGLRIGDDITVEYVATPFELPALLAAGRAKYAVIPEPLTTIALARAREAGLSLTRLMDLQDEWDKDSAHALGFPQVALVVSGELVDEQPRLVARLRRAVVGEAARLQSDPEAGAAELGARFGIPTPIVAEVIDRVELNLVLGGDARRAAQPVLRALHREHPDSVGGKLPDRRFYADIDR